MPRPVWFETPGQGADATAVADVLDGAATEARTPWTFEPVPVPPGTDFALLHQAALVRARRQLAISHAELDRVLSQEVRAIDDLVRTANLLVERLREWYALHAPEATRAVADPEQLARLVSEHGDRASVMAAIDQAAAATTSLGTDLEPGDLEVLRGFAAALAAVHDSWSALEARVSKLMETVAPNVASVVGPVLGARLIALSGGLERLATWPAGTVQLLGAETALFRHIKEGTKPPKHGILFQHPSVHLAAPWSRGAVARALALAASTGAKADAFTKADLREHLAGRVQADMERIAKRRMPSRKPPYGGPSRGPSRGPPRGPPRPWQGAGGAQGGSRGPPAGQTRAPPPWAARAGPAREEGRGPGGGFGPRSDGPRTGGFGPRSDARREGFGPRDEPRGGFAPRDPSRGGSYGPRSEGPRPGGFGPRSDGPRPGGFGPRSDGPRSGGFGPRSDGPRTGGSQWGGKGGPPRRKPQGAFRSDNKPAAPPGKARKDEKRGDE